MAVVCVHPCVGLCEWEPRVGRSLIPRGAGGGGTLLGRSGVSRCLEACAADKPKSFDQKDPLAFLTRLLHHSDVGGPGDL